eukprot:gene32417-36597_t
MSHFLLTMGDKESKDMGQLNGRYCEGALELMLADLEQAGIDPAECQAKVFGGGMMFPGIERSDLLGPRRDRGAVQRAQRRVGHQPTDPRDVTGVDEVAVGAQETADPVSVTEGHAPDPIRQLERVLVPLRSRQAGAVPELTIGHLAERSGVATSTIRFYESRGLVHSRRTTGNQRRYEPSELRRVAFIRAAQRVGLTLDEV